MNTLASRVFMNGNSQAVRIPQEFRLETQRVEITRTANGDLLIHPIVEARGSALLRALQGFDPALAGALASAMAADTPLPPQEREGL